MCERRLCVIFKAHGKFFSNVIKYDMVKNVCTNEHDGSSKFLFEYRVNIEV